MWVVTAATTTISITFERDDDDGGLAFADFIFDSMVDHAQELFLEVERKPDVRIEWDRDSEG